MNRRALARKAAGAKAPSPAVSSLENTGVENVSRKLEDQLAKGDYYGALQMYKTLFMRYLKNEPDHDHQLQAIELAMEASLGLIKHAQIKAATEMATLMVSVYSDFHFPVDNANKERIRKVNAAFMTKPDEYSADLILVLKHAVKWSAQEGSRKRGDPELQLLLARAARANGDFVRAAKHFLHAEQPQEFAQMLWQWSQTGYPSEVDMYLTRAVLQLLSLENLRDANVVNEKFLALVQEKQGKPLDTPLVHFVRFLLLTLERDALPLFQLLQEKYGVVLARDASFKSYLSVIGQKFYGLQPPRTGLSSLLEMFSGGM